MPQPKRPQAVREERAARVAFWLLLAVAFVLRFYRLEAPSLWLDEILVPMAARHPVSYIFDLVTTAEVHPPTYYLLIKGVMALGQSDFALRLLSAGLGVAAVAAIFRVAREHVSLAAALFAAAFLAVNPLAIYISRVVRMYAILLFLLILASGYLLRYLRTGSRRDMAGLLLCNAGLAVTHYVSFVIIAAEFCVLAWAAFREKGRAAWRGVAVFCLGSGVAVGLVLPFFVSRLLRTHQGQFMGYSYPQALANIGRIVSEVLYLFKDWPVRLALAGLALAGLVLLLRDRDRKAGLVFGGLAVLPLVFLAAGKYDYYAFNVWHLSFLLVPAAVLFGRAAAGLASRPLSAAIASGLAGLAVAGMMLTVHWGAFFAWDTTIMPFFTLSKPLARNLPALLDRTGAVVFCDCSTLNGYFWYADQFLAHDPVREQAIGPDGERRTVQFVSGVGSFGDYARSEQEFLAKFGQPKAVRETFQAKVYVFDLPNRSVQRIEALPYAASFDAGLTRFYETVTRAEHVTLDSNWGGAACPTDADREAVIEYTFDNVAPAGGQLLVGHLGFVNTGRQNRFTVRCRFDDEPFGTAAEITGPSDESDLGFVLERERPYARLTVRVEMRLAPYTANFAGGNQMTLGLKRLDLQALPLTPARDVPGKGEGS